jgi:hypothetical protein
MRLNIYNEAKIPEASLKRAAAAKNTPANEKILMNLRVKNKKNRWLRRKRNV